MKVRAYAKVNLALDVVRKREDGYHDLEMIMAPISLHDLIYINMIDHGIEIKSNSHIVPNDERNIMYKVAKVLIDRFHINKGISIFVYKHIPMQAGLAGGSADGAAVIKAMNKMFRLHLSYRQMAEIGKEVGADIPFCIYQRIAFVGGIGDQLDFIDVPFEAMLLLVKPKKGVSTKKAFESLRFDHVKHMDCHKMKQAIIDQNYQQVINNMQNSLEFPSIEMVPEIKTIKEELLALGFDGALMSGSGSCVFGITRQEDVLEKGYEYFKGKYFFVRKTKIMNKGDLL